MKTSLLYFTVLAIFFFISCEKQEISNTFTLGIEKSFKINGEYQSQDNSVKFKITAINDSRCPSDVECIWAGKADVSIDVTSPVSGSLVLSTLNNNIYKSTDTLGNYSFQLINVSPYPISTETIDLEDYQISLKIEEIEH